MRHAPPVRVHIGPDVRVQAVVSAIMGLAVGGLVLTLFQHAGGAWPAFALPPLAMVLAWRAAAVQPRRLRWDGTHWWLSDARPQPGAPDEMAVTVDVVIDLDAWLLLRCAPVGARWAALYLPLARSHHGAQWGSLRATLFTARQAPHSL